MASTHSTQQRLALCFVIAAALFSQSAQAGTRGLKQDALSNSNGCLPTIPKCEAGACAVRNIMGIAKWVCLRCVGNYAPVVDASGQDNIVQCVCPKGHFEANATASSCTRCPANVYCPGGDQVENPISRGAPIQCGNGLVTRNTGARSQSDCVAPAGYAMTNATAATACSSSQYAPAYNRLARCLRCQSGLAENPLQGLVDGGRVSKRIVCKVPPGRYMSQGLVRICPQGFYRENYTDFDAAVAQKCLPCNPGITTDGAGAEGPWKCNRVLAGYGIAQVYNVSASQPVPALPQNETGLPNATICQLGFYSTGGYCARCPANTATRVLGAQAIEACVVPPGYFITAGDMTSCGSGFFRESWLIYSDPKATACTPCGTNILSEPRDLDENPLVANGSYTRATSSSCYIEAGQGMTTNGKNAFAAKDCPVNTYGVSGRVYGWNAAPCKPCPRNMITDGAIRVTSADVCVNDDGFGYASEGASRCAPGFYSAKGSRKPCQQCPTGRTTADTPLLQRLITDCVVAAGFGVVNATSNSTDAFNPDTTGYNDTQLLALPVLECPIGYWSAGNGTGTECTACGAGSTTEAPGASSAAQCSLCVAGYGQATPGAACTPCAYGSYHPGGSTTCTTCPSTTFYPPVAGGLPTYTSASTTLYTGSYEESACVPKRSQMSPEAGQAFFSSATSLPTTAVAGTGTLDDCIAACPTDAACFAQLDGSSCRYALLAASAASAPSPQFVYKIPQATLSSAASVSSASSDGDATIKAKTISSGYYAHGALTADNFAGWFTVGSGLTVDARTFSNSTTPVYETAGSKDDCKKKCDNSNVCIGFIADPQGGAIRCYYRGGIDSLNSRAFFVLPSIPTNNLGW